MQHVAHTIDTTTYGTTYLDMECFDDACAYASATDVSDGEYYTADEGAPMSQERTGNMLMV